MKKSGAGLAAVLVLGVAVSVGYLFGRTGDSAVTAQDVSPTAPRDRDYYVPNSEQLAPDEMRVIACGTGMPTPRPAQAAACFLVELGNGDKFIFDMGDGSVERLWALEIPPAFLNKIFLGHLHGDHFGDLGSMFVAGALGGRHGPLRIWGPSGQVEELGTAYAVQMMENMFTWDLAGRIGQTDTRGFTTDVTEFDYKLENQIVFEENGVTIRAWPAIHAIDGAVSYGLEWNDLKFVFGSDTYPNKWYNEYARDADLAIHECFITVPDFVTKWRATPEAALQVGTQIHTAPEAFGKVMSEIEPRMAVAYHFFKDFDTTPDILERIRKTYDGPLSLAEDFMVWNVTKDDIRVRMALVEERVWNAPMADPALPPDPSEMAPFAAERTGGVVPGYSDFIYNGRWEGVDDVLREIYQEASDALGREFPYPGDEEGGD